MLSAVALSLFAAQMLAVGVVGHGDWLLDGLDNCWRDCLKNTQNGCNSHRCICDASSEDDTYLTSAVECAVTDCDADGWQLDVTFLAPVQLYCGASGEKIPDDIMSSAFSCATAAPTPTSQKVVHSTKPADQHTTKDGGNHGPTSTVTSTVTQTTTNGDGNTVVVIIPIVIGPSMISTGHVVTSTPESKSTATSKPSSADASPTQASQPGPAPSQPAASSPTATTTHGSSSPGNGNGTPFDNPQAGAAQWTFSTLLIAMATIAGLFVRL